jgi:Ran GTPase-activating protein (RanGAP) involved in mRNA processing and transport
MIKAGAKDGHYDKINVRGWSAKVVKQAEFVDPRNGEKLDRAMIPNISPAGLVFLSQELARRFDIQKLDLRYNMLNPEIMTVLAEGLAHNEGIRVLNLKHNEIGDKGTKILIEALAPQDAAGAHQHLIELNLDDNQVGDLGAESIGQLLRCCGIQWLHLRTNRIGSVGARHIADGLRDCSSMHTLLLGDNRIGNDGFEAISEVIRDGHHLITLDAGSNDISDEGLTRICEALRKDDVPLRKLILRVNRILSPGMIQFAEALTEANKNLLELDLGANMIRDEALLALRDLVGYNNTLHKLNLEDNFIGDESGKALLVVLDKNEDSQLISLDFSNNFFSEMTIDRINLFLRTNKAEWARKNEAKKRARAAVRGTKDSSHGSRGRHAGTKESNLSHHSGSRMTSKF